MRCLVLVAVIMASAVCASCSNSTATESHEKWVVYYGHTLPASAFEPFDVVVLDAEHTAPVTTLKSQGKTVLGYLSLGESESYRSFYPLLKENRLLLQENPNWKDHFVIDIRNPKWVEIVNDTLIPDILAKGFDGVMFDTIDSPMHLVPTNEEEQKIFHQASVDLLCTIRSAHPDAILMLNRGFDIMPQAAPCINMLLAESTRTDLQLETVKKPRLLNDEEYGWYIEKMKQMQTANPKLKIYTLDYWPMEDAAGLKRIYADQRGHGFIPYVSTMDLQQVFNEPQ